MSLVYRGMWRVSEADLHSLGQETFNNWVHHKYDLDHHQSINSPLSAYRSRDHRLVKLRMTSADTGETENGRATRRSLEEDVSGEFWKTTLTMISTPDEQWVWVDTDNVSSNLTAPMPPIVAPRFVNSLISAESEIGGFSLSTRAFRISEIPEVVAAILDESREIPIAVFTPESGDKETWVRRAEAAAKQLAGLTLVWMLPPESVQPFCDQIGEELAVWGGGVRTYLPVRTGRLEPNRHRYIPAARLRERDIRFAARVIGNQLEGTTRRRRPPQAYRSGLSDLLQQSDRGGGDLSAAEDLLEELTAMLEDRDSRIADLEDEVYSVRSDFEEVQRRELAVVQRASYLESLRPLTPEEHADSNQIAYPADASSIHAAIANARTYCTSLVLPLTAEFDIDDMEATCPDTSFANAIWRALVSLDQYAKSEFEGDFRAWAIRSGNPYTISPGRIAMSESETTSGGGAARRAREFYIDPAVGEGQKVFMPAHLKPVNGYGDFVPRIYFHDDVRGKTGKVHIGAIGPHRRFPNSKTN